jgi:hypothetical protein
MKPLGAALYLFTVAVASAPDIAVGRVALNQHLTISIYLFNTFLDSQLTIVVYGCLADLYFLTMVLHSCVLENMKFG